MVTFHWDTEFPRLGFDLPLLLYFFTGPTILPLEWLYIWFCFMFQVCDLVFILILQGVTVKRLSCESEDTLNFDLLNIVKTLMDYGDF